MNESMLCSGRSIDLSRWATSCYNHFLSKSTPNKTQIPKILHFIWLQDGPGSAIPSKYSSFIESWRGNYPDWQIRLWFNHDSLLIDMKNALEFTMAENVGMKSGMTAKNYFFRHFV